MDTKFETSNQILAWAVAFELGKQGKIVRLSKENGQWLVKILAD